MEANSDRTADERKTAKEGEMESQLIRMCVQSATLNRAAVESWRRQRRNLEKMPFPLGDALLRGVIRRRLVFPSLLEVFKLSVEEVDLRAESSVDIEWMAYLGGFRFLRSLNLADCKRINDSALWYLSGMENLKELNLSRCSMITDAGIRHLTTIHMLGKLWISETRVTANGVMLLSSLPNLVSLDLGGLAVTDVALSSLQGLRGLEYLDLWGSELSNEGAQLLTVFHKLEFLNLAWTAITKLPSLPSLVCLNLSNCTIHSVFDGAADKIPLVKLILSGATLEYGYKTFLHIETTHLSYLDMSHASVKSFGFLDQMDAITHLDLSGTSLDDDSIKSFGGKRVRHLNLSSTRITSSGVMELFGSFPNIEVLLLSGTSIDGHAMMFISLLTFLKVLDISKTNVKDFSYVRDLDCLERLDLEELEFKDGNLGDFWILPRLNHLSLRSNLLTDNSFNYLSNFANFDNIVHLGIRDAILTSAGIAAFDPPLSLRMLDIRGCWLLTEDDLYSFHRKHPQVEVKHDLVHIMPSDEVQSSHSSPSGRTRNLQFNREGSPSTHLDQRLKYSREEMLALQMIALKISSDVSQGS